MGHLSEPQSYDDSIDDLQHCSRCDWTGYRGDPCDCPLEEDRDE